MLAMDPANRARRHACKSRWLRCRRGRAWLARRAGRHPARADASRTSVACGGRCARESRRALRICRIFQKACRVMPRPRRVTNRAVWRGADPMYSVNRSIATCPSGTSRCFPPSPRHGGSPRENPRRRASTTRAPRPGGRSRRGLDHGGVAQTARILAVGRGQDRVDLLGLSTTGRGRLSRGPS